MRPVRRSRPDVRVREEEGTAPSPFSSGKSRRLLQVVGYQVMSGRCYGTSPYPKQPAAVVPDYWASLANGSTLWT